MGRFDFEYLGDFMVRITYTNPDGYVDYSFDYFFEYSMDIYEVLVAGWGCAGCGGYSYKFDDRTSILLVGNQGKHNQVCVDNPKELAEGIRWYRGIKFKELCDQYGIDLTWGTDPLGGGDL